MMRLFNKVEPLALILTNALIQVGVQKYNFFAATRTNALSTPQEEPIFTPTPPAPAAIKNHR